MNISARCEYACRAVVELASLGSSGEPVTAQTIASRRNIPEKYLVHILLQLKRAGLVESVRGAQGGYLLTKPPEAVSLLDIVKAIDGPVLEPLPAQDAAESGMTDMWKRVSAEIAEVLSQWTIRRLLDAAKKDPMYYI